MNLCALGTVNLHSRTDTKLRDVSDCPEKLTHTHIRTVNLEQFDLFLNILGFCSFVYCTSINSGELWLLCQSCRILHALHMTDYASGHISTTVQFLLLFLFITCARLLLLMESWAYRGPFGVCFRVLLCFVPVHRSLSTQGKPTLCFSALLWACPRQADLGVCADRVSEK